MTQRLGDGKWLDVNGDNIGIQVRTYCCAVRCLSFSATLSWVFGVGCEVNITAASCSSKV